MSAMVKETLVLQQSRDQEVLARFHRWLVDRSIAVEGYDSFRLASFFLEEEPSLDDSDIRYEAKEVMTAQREALNRRN